MIAELLGVDGLLQRYLGLHLDRYGNGNPTHYGPHNGDDNPNGDNDQDQNDDEDNSAPPLPHIPPFGNYYDPPISPLVLDLDGDGIELIALSDSRTLFDLDSDGFAQHTGWVAPDDALLAIDRNGNGRIDDIIGALRQRDGRRFHRTRHPGLQRRRHD